MEVGGVGQLCRAGGEGKVKWVDSEAQEKTNQAMAAWETKL